MHQNHPNIAGSILSAGQTLKEEAYQEQTKPWAECTEEQKLERLRDGVREMRHTFRWINDRFSRIENMLRRLEYHQHGGDGTVLIRPRDAEAGYGQVEAAQQIFDPLA